MRALWTGSISFGLINIPVRLYSGSEHNEGLDLTMLHKKDLSPIRYARICRRDGKEIPYDQIVKGYEYKDGDYIVLTDEDFKRANARKTKTIDIAEFVLEGEIDSRYYEKPYYLEPQKGADKSYALLRDALNKSGKIAIAKFVLRNREHLGALKPVGRALVLNQMRFPTEIRSPAKLDLPAGSKAGQKEIKMAMALIEQLTEPFIPEDFHDTYIEELQEAIEKKAKGKPAPKKGAEPEPTKVGDLMSALKASLDKQAKTKSG
ncbi:MAG TPA: Ku protein [Candidatus Dormibacteraeota bacterium]|nr:Ku protein [Candidatus Dormibacteraeota bacterium]